jgi:hypothetical protein
MPWKSIVWFESLARMNVLVRLVVGKSCVRNFACGRCARIVLRAPCISKCDTILRPCPYFQTFRVVEVYGNRRAASDVCPSRGRI